MNHAITIEMQFFVISILWGTLLLLVYDGLRIFRRLIKHDSFFVAVEDLIFWVMASLFIFAMMYKENNGIIRGFSVMGMAVGMVLYHYLLSELIVKTVTSFIRLLFKPIGLAINKLRLFIKYAYCLVKNVLKNIVTRLKKWTKSVRIALNTRKQALALERKKRKDKKIFDKMLQQKKKAEQKEAKKIAKAKRKEIKNKNKKRAKSKDKKTKTDKKEKRRKENLLIQ